MHHQDNHGPAHAALLTAIAQAGQLSQVPWTLAAQPGGPFKEAIHDAAATGFVHVAERALAPRTRRPNRRPAVRVLAALGFAGYVAARKAGTR